MVKLSYNIHIIQSKRLNQAPSHDYFEGHCHNGSRVNGFFYRLNLIR